MSTATLALLLKACAGEQFPALTSAERHRLQAESHHLQQMLAKDVPVYGSNRHPGHRENEVPLSAETLERDILDSHAIGEAPWYEPREARSIGIAKLAMWRAGGSGVSPEMFDRVNRLLNEAEFKPLIPRRNSYSAGDVIPAAHWAKAILTGSKETGRYTGPPETMALLNGAFVHAGLAMTTVRPLCAAWVLFFENTVGMMHALRNNCFLSSTRAGIPPIAQAALKALRVATKGLPTVTGLQDAISLRATDEIFETLMQAIQNMAQQLNDGLRRPSCNPKIDLNQPRTVSQASFFLPSLTVAQSSLIEALLFTMWAQVGRVNYLLGGEAKGIPLDAASSDKPLGLIQHPKQMMALLEEARSAAGRTVYSSGSSTSRGIEDLWSHGLTTTETLLATVKRFGQMSAIEAHILEHLRAMSWIPAGPAEARTFTAPSQRLEALVHRLDTDSGYPRHGFPVRC